IYHLPSTIYHLPSTIYHLPSTIYHLPSTIYHLTDPAEAPAAQQALVEGGQRLFMHRHAEVGRRFREVVGTGRHDRLGVEVAVRRRRRLRRPVERARAPGVGRRFGAVPQARPGVVDKEQEGRGQHE